jgi:tRNA-dihydrouridine synthase B
MSYWNSPLKIGSLSVPRFLGGPLDRLTDAPFRSTTRLFTDSALLYTEIRHVAAVVKMPRALVQVDQATRPINFQMTASSTDYIEQACSLVLEIGVDAVDLNIGCPATNVVKSGSGSALMGDVPRLEKVLKCFRAHLTCPFTVKMRAGFKEHNAEIVAKLCQDCGVDALVVHPRLQKQKFKGMPDYSILASVKKHVQIPVIVSGGINNFEVAQAVYNQTGVDGFLIGRAQLGAPWLLRQLHEQSRGSMYELERNLVYDAIVKHMKHIEQWYGKKGLSVARRHIGFYMHGRDNGYMIRRQAHDCASWAAVHEVVSTLNQGWL